MKARFIFNPTSGRNRRRPWLARTIRDFISARALDADLATTEGPGHATELARDAVQAGCPLVVAVGGDGTMNEVAQALRHTPTALALVPCGSGNGLALHLRLPRSLGVALDLIAGDRSRVAALDTGSANGLPFFNAMGLGLDADVSRRFNTLTKRGLPAYARTALAVVRELRHESVTITAEGRRETLDVLLLAIANSDQYGNNARIAPGARVDDGLLDLVAVGPTGFFGAAALAARLFLGNVDRSAHVRRWRGAHFLLERRAAGVIHTDGETHLTDPKIEIAVHPRSLRVLVPIASRAVAPAADAPATLALQLP
ncbi:MAG TPA: YegS/Rv2252/BmrU family lipid kinase [Opitutaceae bacterium]|nr:YegS/Rv2252/BmrU family lipid kinase [Opitutaceae bacterium]